MKKLTLLVLFLGTAAVPALPVFIGTNTQGKSESKGIYRADFDPETGKLSTPVLAAEYQSPGFLALHPSKPVLLSIGAPKTPFPDQSGSVAAFSIAADHSLRFLGEASSGGRGPCHLAVDASGGTVAVANYGDGSISLIALDGKGVPGKILHRLTNSGSGPNTQRQKGPHAHGVYFDSGNHHLFVPDLGIDKVLVYQLGGGGVPKPLEPLRTPPGAGPRHLAFTPDEKHVYVINELDNTVLCASYDGRGGFKAIGTVPTLPEGFAGQNTTSEIEVSADGRFVYGSNRGHDSIVVFRRDAATGALEVVQNSPCGGRIPRHFKIAPGGRWLLCAHQDSSTISVLPIDPDTGKLGSPAQTVASPTPICILFPR